MSDHSEKSWIELMMEEREAERRHREILDAIHKAGKQATPPVMVCSFCGAHSYEHMCPNCGAPTGLASYDPPKPAPKPVRRPSVRKAEVDTSFELSAETEDTIRSVLAWVVTAVAVTACSSPLWMSFI